MSTTDSPNGQHRPFQDERENERNQMNDDPKIISDAPDSPSAAATEKDAETARHTAKTSSTAFSDDSTTKSARNRVHIDRVRDWLIPRSVLGLVSLVLAFSIGASISGVAFYAFYQYQQTQTTKRVNNYINGFDERFHTASDSIDNQKQRAQAQIQEDLAPLIQASGGGKTFSQMAEKVKGSVWFVQTQDVKGAPSVGSAFVVQSNDKQSLLLTSYATVQASTAAPGPSLQVTKGNEKINAKLLNWVEDQDIAVLSIDKGGLTALKFVPDGKLPGQGDRVFAASGLGGAGAAISQGYVNDASNGLIQHSAPLGVSFQGGPLLDSEGRVIGTTSLRYAPLGFSSNNGVMFSLPIRDTCAKLLTCPNNDSVDGAKNR